MSLHVLFAFYSLVKQNKGQEVTGSTEEDEMKEKLIVNATVLQQPWTVDCPSELDELGEIAAIS